MLLGHNVRLRAIEREDLPTFVRWLNDPEVRGYLEMYLPLSMAQEERWFQSLLERRDEVVLAVEARVEHTWVHIGSVGLHRIDWKNRRATVGIVLGEKKFWDRGYGTEALRTLLKFAFHELGLHRVELEVYAFNARAIRCYEKVGFKQEGVRREALFRDGRFHDILVMGLLAEEFQG